MEERNIERRNKLRAEIAETLRQGGPMAELLEAGLRIMLQHMADGASIDLVEDDGSIARVMTRHNDPQKEQTLDTYRREHPLPPTSSYGYQRVIKTGKSQFIPGVTSRLADRLYPEARTDIVLDGLTIRSYICVPLIARGRTLGALTVKITDENRSFSTEDLVLFEEIAILLAEALDERLRLRGGSASTLAG